MRAFALARYLTSAGLESLLVVHVVSFHSLISSTTTYIVLHGPHSRPITRHSATPQPRSPCLTTHARLLLIMNIAASTHATDMPWLFSATASQTPNALALARAGGVGGNTYTYIDEALGTSQGSCSTMGTGGRQWV